MIGSVARGRLVSVSITVTALGLVLVGCSAVPYAPGPSFEPSSSPPAAQVSAEPGPQPTSKPDVDLRGTLVTQDGLVTPVHSELWFEQSTTASGSSAGATGRTRLRVWFQGAVTITSRSDRINVPAASVQIEYRVAYPATSHLCRLLPKETGSVSGDYCWQLIGDASPSGEHGDLVALQPHEVRSLTVRGIDASLDIPSADVERLADDVRRPALVVAATTAVPTPTPSNRFAHACRTPAEAPSGPSGKGAQFSVQHVVVGATRSIGCDQLPELGA